MPERSHQATRALRHAALLVAMSFSMLVAFAGSAQAHQQLGQGDVPTDVAAAITHDTLLAAELALLPRETPGGSCLGTRHVTGIGDACRTVDGLLRIPMAGGGSAITHGGDAPRADSPVIAAMPHLPASQHALDTASVDDVACVTGASDRRLELVYAYPADRPDRSATVAAQLRQALYEASAFVDAESQLLDPDSGRRIRALCSSGIPVVHVVQLDAIGSGGATYGGVVDQLVARGFPAQVWNSTSTRRFAVFYDAPAASGAAGTAAIFTDETPGSSNDNNRGGRYAVEYDWSSSRAPHWDVLLHEITHNMGGAQDNAPGSSGAGHCNDGLDVLCYDDGGPLADYSSTTCAQERYDCGGDTYFHPSPPAGTYLANNWNVGSTGNAWLEPRFTGWDDGGVPDTDPPTVPTGLALALQGSSRVLATWQASVDARSDVRYDMEVDRDASGSWVLDQTWTALPATSLTLEGLQSGTSYRVRVRAVDQAGNQSAEASAEVSTTSALPQPPPSVGITAASSTQAAVAWSEGSAGAGIWYYEVQLSAGGGTWFTYANEAGTSTTISSLTPGTTYQARVRTVALDESVSQWRLGSAAATLPGGLREDGGSTATATAVQVTAIGQTIARAEWTGPAGTTTWTVVLVDASRVLWSRSFTGSAVTIGRLRPSTAYTLVVAPAGQSRAGTASFTTRADTVRPGLVRTIGPAQVRRGVLRVRWRPVADASGIRRYDVQRRVGRRWVRIRKPAAARAVTIRGVRGRVVVRIRAVDRAGNAGAWRLVRAATPRRR